MNDPRVRPAVRALVIDHEDRVLLARLVFPQGAWWVLPGGGIDHGEDPIDALHRELREETGLEGASIGPVVWNRVHYFSMTDTEGRSWDGQQESVHLVRTEHFVPSPLFSDAELRNENLHELRWWTQAELLAHDGPDRLSPPGLASYLQTLINEGVPDTPFSIVQSG